MKKPWSLFPCNALGFGMAPIVLTNTPELLTLLGAATAVALGAQFKRRRSKD